MFELCYRREAYRIERGHYIRTSEKDKDLPDRPAGFRPFTGLFPEVARRADELNSLQVNAEFMFYFYFPEPIPAHSNPNHCDACRRAQKMREPQEPDA
jgi:hypothetical protein